MKKRVTGVLALVLALCLLLGGCALDFGGYFRQVGQLLVGSNQTHFQDMVYTRPNLQDLQTTIDRCCEKLQSAKNLDAVVTIIYEAYAPLDAFSTAYALSNIYYCKDLTSSYWAGEYAFCSENAVIVEAALDQFYRALAQCRFREELEGDNYFGAGFFDNYQGEGVYDEVFTKFLTQEAALESQYYALWNAAGNLDMYSQVFLDNYGLQMEQLYVQLIALRQEMAAYLGYNSYPEFAYDFYYGRDYTCQQTTSYLADIRAELVPLYRQMVGVSGDLQVGYSTESQTLAYVEEMARSMGGTIWQAYQRMAECGLYDISYSPNKYNASFEVYIRGYRSPYLFMNPTLTEYDKLSMAHEFGHFCCDYVTGGSGAGVDVGEIFSQGMEYLSLCHTTDGARLEQMKMFTCLSILVEQAAYASFEQQVYGLQGDALTVENVRALHQQVGEAYGFDTWGFDARSYVYVTHFYTNPMYVISYVVSNDVALQMYQMEKAQAGAGVTALTNAFYSADTGIVAFTGRYGLESPFAAGRIQRIKQTLLEAFG